MTLDGLDALYRTYGFRKKQIQNSNASVYTYDTGYFHNADIVCSPDNAEEAERIKQDFERAGYSSQIRLYSSIEEAENGLFDGFFSVEETKKELLSLYREYCDKHKRSVGVEYEYIPSDYSESDVGEDRIGDIVSEISGLLDGEGPQLIVVEAAAGFGKTTTVYEVLHRLAKSGDRRLPFLAELSKNRQAQIFKYVLLDEINRQFPTLNLEVVNYEVRRGNLVLIVDGFDELLKKSEEKDDSELIDSAEPMLETISSLLKGNAKIILTTRKTALFSGDGFHCWVENHSLEFDVKRFSLHEPNVEKWIGRERKSRLLEAGFDLSIVPNPVLLSWLRGMSEEAFQGICSHTELLIDNYFTQLLEREKGRQELLATPEEQQSVFRSVADHLVSLEVTTDSKEGIEGYIAGASRELIRTLRQRYPAESRPTEEQIIEKLSLHALLDRKPNGAIGFVNDFVFGFFVGEALVEKADPEWVAEDERFIDYAITSFRNRNACARESLWEVINFYIELLSSPRKYQADFYLAGGIKRDYEGEVFEEQIFILTEFGGSFSIKTTTFTNCVFRDCDFNFGKIDQTYFVGCRFYQSRGVGIHHGAQFYGCSFEAANGFELPMEMDEEAEEICSEWERHVLSKIWPQGAARLSMRRAVRTIKMGVQPCHAPDIDDAIESLRKRGVVEVDGQTVVVNIEKIGLIRKCLGKE